MCGHDFHTGLRLQRKTTGLNSDTCCRTTYSSSLRTRLSDTLKLSLMFQEWKSITPLSSEYKVLMSMKVLAQWYAMWNNMIFKTLYAQKWIPILSNNWFMLTIGQNRICFSIHSSTEFSSAAYRIDFAYAWKCCFLSIWFFSFQFDPWSPVGDRTGHDGKNTATGLGGQGLSSGPNTSGGLWWVT